MTPLRLPPLSASPFGLIRSGLRWLRPPGAILAAREPLAVCGVRVAESRRGARTGDGPVEPPLAEEQNDLQVVLAPRAPGRVAPRADQSRGGYQDLVAAADWEAGEAIADGDAEGGGELQALVLMGRRGFENGEARGGLLPGWYERTRASWEGDGGERFGTVLSYGTCEQTALFRGDEAPFVDWFARAPGPAQLVWVPDERTVHSSAVVLQHLRRTPAEARAIAGAVHGWITERLTAGGPDAFPAFLPDSARGRLGGRWAEAQGALLALHLLSEAVGSSPLLERTQVLTRRGVAEQPPPDAVALSLGSEFASHFRHRRTGWILAFHGFRFGQFIGPAFVDWLRRDFEPVPRTVADVERDLAAVADEVSARTGGALLVQNLIASSAADRVPNHAWLGDGHATSLPVQATEANLMLLGLTRHPAVSVVDSDALAAELGVRHCPDRFHAARELLDAQREEVHRVLRDRRVPGF